MKKLLILMLVLGLASMASAVPVSLSIRVGTDPNLVEYVGSEYSDETAIDILQNDTIYIGVYNSASGNVDQFAAYLEFDSTSTSPDAEFTGSGVIYQPPAVPTIEDAPAITYYGYTATYAVDWLYGNMQNGSPTDFTGVGVVFAVEFECLVGDDSVVTVRLMDANYEQIDSIDITQIPEPATIALLGLGSLFLMRRRRK